MANEHGKAGRTWKRGKSSFWLELRGSCGKEGWKEGASGASCQAGGGEGGLHRGCLWRPSQGRGCCSSNHEVLPGSRLEGDEEEAGDPEGSRGSWAVIVKMRSGG